MQQEIEFDSLLEGMKQASILRRNHFNHHI
jgi:hypothetical protein